MGEEVEKHSRGFRGVFCPAEILEMVGSGAITPQELTLLLVVESFVHHTGRDCWASNEYLAGPAQTTPNRASRCISRLKEKGLLIQTGFDGRKRYLQTAWSRLQGARQTYAIAQGRLTPERKVLNTNTTDKDKLGPANAEAPTDRSSLTLHPRWIRYATKLATAVQSVKKVKCSQHIKTWARSIYLLHKVEGVEKERIKRALRWYCEQLPLQHGTQYFLVIESGASFRTKFTRLEALIDRTKRDAGESTEEEKPVKFKIERTVNMEDMTEDERQKFLEGDE